jgi:hypothetical protein
MRLKAALVLGVLAGLVITIASFAQEGHPLTGIWYGDWGAGSAAQRNSLTIQMQWDGKSVTGLANPGPDSYPLKVVTLDSSKWTVHIEADAKDDKGTVSKVVADGKLENIGSYNRTITGTWQQGNTKGTFKLKRD